MEFKNIVKGQITQALIKTLLEGAGYRVERLGIEELFSDLKHLDYESYVKLDLPENLRKLPDLLVSDLRSKECWMIEVKYRRKLDKQNAESLYNTLTAQYKYWPKTYTIIIRGDCDKKILRHQNVIGVITPDALDSWLKCSSYETPDYWRAVKPLHKVFPAFDWKEKNLETFDNTSNADLLSRVMVRHLISLDELDEF